MWATTAFVICSSLGCLNLPIMVPTLFHSEPACQVYSTVMLEVYAKAGGKDQVPEGVSFKCQEFGDEVMAGYEVVKDSIVETIEKRKSDRDNLIRDNSI